MFSDYFCRLLSFITILFIHYSDAQSCKVYPLIKQRISGACSLTDYSYHNFGQSVAVASGYTITGWISTEPPQTSGNVVYALYTTAGSRVFALHLSTQTSVLKVQLFGKGTNQIFINNFPYSSYQWIFTAVTIYASSFDIFIMRSYNPTDLVSLSNVVVAPDFEQITAGYTLKVASHRYETYYSFCGYLTYFNLLTFDFKSLSSDNKFRLMYSGGDPYIIAKYDFTDFQTADYEIDLSNQGHNIYQSQYQLSDNNLNMFDLKLSRPSVPIQLNPIYPINGDSFPYPGYTVSFWCYIQSVASQSYLFTFKNEFSSNTIVSVSAKNDPTSGYFVFCIYSECQQDGATNPQSTWIHFTLTVRNQQINTWNDGAIIEYYINGVFKKKIQFNTKYLENPYSTNSLQFSFAMTNSVYIKSMIITRGVMTESVGSTCLSSNNCSFSLGNNNKCVLCSAGYSLTQYNSCALPTDCGTTTLNKSFIQDANISICQEKCQKSCKDCDLPTRTCNTCYSSNITPPTCSCAAGNIYKDQVRGICLDSRSDELSQIRIQIEQGFSNSGELTKTVSLIKDNFNILNIFALTSFSISKNSGTSKDISFYVQPMIDQISISPMSMVHYKNTNIQMDSMEYSYLINYNGQQSMKIKNLKIEIPSSHSLRVNGSGTYVFSYNHDLREYTPYVTIFLTGYGLVKGTKVDIRLTYSAVTKTDMIISIASSGDSPMYAVNVCIVFSRFMTLEQAVSIPSYFSTYSTDYKGIRETESDFTVNQEQDYYVPFIYGVNSISYTATSDLKFSLSVTKNTPIQYKYNLQISSDTQIQQFKFSLLRFQPIKTSDSTVIECFPSCTECSVSTNTCITCQDPLRTPPYCKCITQYFTQTDGTCAQCNQRCSYCDLTAKNCQICASANTSGAPACDCLSGFTYVGTDESICRPCGNKCETCSGSETNCTKCFTGRINFPSCTCPDGSYDDGISKSCLTCPIECTKCSSNSSCSECKDGYVLIGNQCQKCDYKCGTCQNADITNCLICYNDLRINAPSCSCKNGYYDSNTNDPNCQKCHIYCQTCVNQDTECQSCNGNRIFDGVNACNCPVGSLNDIVGSAFCEMCNLSGGSIQYSQDYSEVYITFTYNVKVNTPLDTKIATYSDINCQEVLVTNVVNNLGQGYQCALGSDNKTFVIKLGYGSTLSENVIFQLNDFKIRSDQPSCISTYITNFAINKITKPNTSKPPIVVLSTNTQIFNVCSKIQIYISSVQNSGGRTLKNFVWNEVSNKVTIPSAYINQPILVFEPNTLTKSTNYQFILTYTSSYEVSGQTSILITTLDDSTAFQFYVTNAIDGSNTFKYYSYQGIQLKAYILLNSCTSSQEEFTVQIMQWKQKFGNFNGKDLRSDKIENTVLSLSQAVFSFTVSPFTPVPKDKYEFEAETMVRYQGFDISLKYTVYIEIIQSPLIVQILGGDTIRQWNKEFNLVAYVFDPNTKEEFKNDSQVSISWKCTQDGTDQECLWYDGTFFKDFANNKLSIKIPERTFKYFQRVQLSVIVRRPNIDGTILSGTHQSEIMFLDYELQSFQIQLPHQLSQDYISFSDQILFNINDSNLLSNFKNSIDDLTFKTSIQYESNTYFQQYNLQSFNQFIMISNLYSLNKLNQKDRMKIVFEIDSAATSIQYKTSYSIFAVDSPKNCELSVANNAISVNNCQSQFLPLQYRISLYLAKKISSYDDIDKIQNHEYINLFGAPFSVSNTFSSPGVIIYFDFIADGSQEEGFVLQLFTKDNQGSVSKQAKKIKNLVFSINPSTSSFFSTQTDTLMSLATIMQYLYGEVQSTQLTALMSKLRPYNEETIAHYNLYWSRKLSNGIIGDQNRILKYTNESDQRILADEESYDTIAKEIMDNISQTIIPYIFEFELIWQNYKKFNIYHTQERLLFSTLRLIESLIDRVSEDKLKELYNILINLCQKAISLTQLNNKPLSFEGSILNIYLAKYTSKILANELYILPQNPTSSISSPYEIIQISQYSSTLFSQINSFPKGKQRSQIISYHIRQNNSNIKLADVHPVYLQATIGNDFDKDLFVCISYKPNDTTSDSFASQDGEWTSSDCSTVVQASGVDVICYCKTLDSVVLLEDTENIFINPSDTDLHEMKDIIKYPILILILVQLILYIIFTVYSVAKDEMDLVKVNTTVVPYSLVVPNTGISTQDLQKFEQHQKQLLLKEQDLEQQKQQIIKTQQQLQKNINSLKQNHDTIMKQQQQQIKNMQEEQKIKLDNQQKAYEAKIQEIQQRNNMSSAQSTKSNQEKMQELEKNFQKQQEEQKEKFRQQQEQLMNQQREQIKKIEEEEKTVQIQIEQQEKNMEVFKKQLDPEVEKNAPKNPIKRVIWFMSRGSQQELPQTQAPQKLPLGRYNSIEGNQIDVSPFNGNKNGQPQQTIFEMEKQKLLEPQPQGQKGNSSNKGIVSLQQFDDAISNVGTQAQFGQTHSDSPQILIKDKSEETNVQLLTTQQNQNNINFDPKKNIFIPLSNEPAQQMVRQEEPYSRSLPLDFNKFIPITFEVILKGYFRVHEFFSAVFTYENQISRTLRFSVIFLKYMMMAIILGKVQNGQYSLNLIFSVPLAFVVSIISNITICLIKALIRSSRLKKALGLILLFLSLIVVVFFLTTEFLSVKAPGEKWWYAYLFAIGADFVVIEFIIVAIKFIIFKSLYQKKQFHSNFDINMWMYISTNDITNYLVKNN